MRKLFILLATVFYVPVVVVMTMVAPLLGRASPSSLMLWLALFSPGPPVKKGRTGKRRSKRQGTPASALRAPPPPASNIKPRTGAVVLTIYNILLKHRWMYGAQIIDESRLKSGSVYPALARLRAAGIIAVENKDPLLAKDGRSDRRVVYALTDEGKEHAVNELRLLGLPVPDQVPVSDANDLIPNQT